MKILSIQSNKLYLDLETVYPNNSCNYKHALPVYNRLFKDYNDKFKTNYKSFFWGFSKLCADNDLEYAIYRALEMLQTDLDNKQILILDVPDDICLETDFYNFSDEIFAYENPQELASNWDKIYEKRESGRQVIFPFIKKEWLIGSMKDYKVSEDFLKPLQLF
jgi:hypothetical protein